MIQKVKSTQGATMPATAFQGHLIAEARNFQRRVSYFMSEKASLVLAEPPATVGYTERVEYADSVLGGSASVKNHALLVMTNATIAAGADPNDTADGSYGISDSDLQFAVHDTWNAMSGVTTGA